MRFSVPRVKPDCTCRVFSTKLRVIFHDFARQLFDQLFGGSRHLGGWFSGCRV